MGSFKDHGLALLVLDICFYVVWTEHKRKSVMLISRAFIVRELSERVK